MLHNDLVPHWNVWIHPAGQTVSRCCSNQRGSVFARAISQQVQCPSGTLTCLASTKATPEVCSCQVAFWTLSFEDSPAPHVLHHAASVPEDSDFYGFLPVFRKVEISWLHKASKTLRSWPVKSVRISKAPFLGAKLAYNFIARFRHLWPSLCRASFKLQQTGMVLCGSTDQCWPITHGNTFWCLTWSLRALRNLQDFWISED